MQTTTLEDERWAAFIERYEETVPAVYAYLVRACAGERARAEDLTQETYSTALAAWKAGTVEELSLSWLLTVARHKMIDGYRKADTESRHFARLPRPRTFDDPVSTHIDDQRVLECIRALPPLQRAVITLRFVDDLPTHEVAALLGRRKGSIDGLQRRALAKLRTMLEENDDEH